MLTNSFNGYPIHLIETLDELKSAISKFSKDVFVGIDTETHSLTYGHEQVVGICISGGTDYSTNNYHGYYIPLRHRGYSSNFDPKEVLPYIQGLVDNYTTVFFNRNFDLSMLEYDGLKVPFVGRMYDAQVMCFLVFNEHYPSLKEYTKNILKWKVTDFETISGGDHDFGNTDPRVSYLYAASDPVMTVFLARTVWSRYPNIRKIYKIDNYALEAVRRMMQQTLTIDYDFVKREYDRTEAKLKSVQENIYAMTGVYGFNIGSAREKADVLSRFMTLTKKTKSGAFAMDADTLKELNHPVAKLMVEWNETRTYLNSFLVKILGFKGREVRINYSTVNVASGRLSSGAAKGNNYYAPLNIQNQPKLEEKLYVHHHEHLGYCLKREQEGCVVDKEGNPCKLKTKTGLHEAYITGHPDWVWLTGDYAGQEMRLAANFSGEPNFLNPMLSGEDIHAYVSRSMFGFFDPNNRTRVKILNFCLGEDSYVMTPRGMIRPKALRPDDLLYKIQGGTQTFRMEVRPSKTVKVHYSNGVVEEYDERHQVAITSEHGIAWKRVCDLTGEDEVLTTLGYMKPTSDDLVLQSSYNRNFETGKHPQFSVSTPEFAYLMGLYLGDGCVHLSKKGTPKTFSFIAEEELYGKVERCIEKLGFPVKYHVYSGKNYRAYRINCVAFCKVVVYLFGRTKGKTISDIIFERWGKDLFIPLLQGLVDSDGSRARNQLIYYTTSDELARKVALALQGVGVYVREFVLKKHNCHCLRMSRNGIVQSNLKRKQCEDHKNCITFKKYNPQILEGLSWNFERGLADNLRRKKQGLSITSSLVEAAGYKGLYPISVVSVSEPQAGKIYVIETESGSYISSGIASHNSCLYGAEGPTIAQRLGVSRDEGCSLFDHYKQTMSRLYKWKAVIIANAKRAGYAFTYFGRPIYLLKYFNSADRGMRSYAERLAVNSTIQGSLPPTLFLPSQDGMFHKPIYSYIGKDVLYATDERNTRNYGVPTYRGVDQLAYVEFRSGDFIVCSLPHKFLAADSDRLLTFAQAFDTPIRLHPSAKKMPLLRTLWHSIFNRTKDVLSALAPHITHGKLPANDFSIAASLLNACLLRVKVRISDRSTAAVYRSAIDLYGYNLIAVGGDKYRVAWSRKSKSLATFVAKVGCTNVVSPCMVSGYQTYPLAGFIHKNTGGDLIRIALVKFEKLRDLDPSWRENVKFQITVHDECNFSVHRTYLYKAWKGMCKVMNFFPSNFKVPVVIEPGVGARGWGDCLDFVCVSKDNRIIPNGFHPDNFEGAEREYLLDILQHCDVNDLPANLKEFKK